LRTFALYGRLKVTVLPVGKLHNSIVMVLLEPRVELPRIRIGLGVSLVHLRSSTSPPFMKTVASRPTG